LNPLAESFNRQGYVEEREAVNTINSEPRRSSRLKEKREKLMSRTQTPNDIVSQTADVNNADLACRSTSPSFEEVEEITPTDRDAVEGDRPDEVINQTQGLDEQPTVKQQVAARPDDSMPPPLVQDIIRDPVITGNDYLKDEEFGDMYKNLRYNQLTGDSETDRRLLLIAENYYVENDLLYKIALPRGKQEKRLKPTVFQLCVPKMFRHNLLTQFHDILGHFSYQRLMPTISARFYWKNLPNDIKEFVRTCVTCQFSKVSTNKPTNTGSLLIILANLFLFGNSRADGQLLCLPNSLLFYKKRKGQGRQQTHLLG